MIRHKFLLSLIVPVTLCLSATSFAQSEVECSTDADCGDGGICEKEMWVSGCNPEAGPCDDTVHESETGWCYTPPPTCESDSDCGEYLSCQSSDAGVCWASSDGTSGCEDPDPDAPKYCEVAYEECSQDSDCPREFECVETYSCIDIGCAEGSECDIAPCEPSGGECIPKEIECDTDSECPSDWSCIKLTETECASDGDWDGDSPGGDSSDPSPGDDSGAAPAPREEPEPVAPEPTDDECTVVESPGFCAPDAWDDHFFGEIATSAEGGNDAGTDLDGSAGPTESEDSDDSGSEASGSGGGCSVSSGAAPTGGWLWMALMSAPLFLRRRRAS